MKKISLLFYCFFITTFSISINTMETPPNSPDYSNMSTADLISRIRCLESILRAKNLAEQERLNAMKEFTDYQCNETDDTQTADADNLELSDCICS